MKTKLFLCAALIAVAAVPAAVWSSEEKSAPDQEQVKVRIRERKHTPGSGGNEPVYPAPPEKRGKRDGVHARGGNAPEGVVRGSGSPNGWDGKKALKHKKLAGKHRGERGAHNGGRGGRGRVVNYPSAEQPTPPVRPEPPVYKFNGGESNADL